MHVLNFNQFCMDVSFAANLALLAGVASPPDLCVLSHSAFERTPPAGCLIEGSQSFPQNAQQKSVEHLISARLVQDHDRRGHRIDAPTDVVILVLQITSVLVGLQPRTVSDRQSSRAEMVPRVSQAAAYCQLWQTLQDCDHLIIYPGKMLGVASLVTYLYLLL